jgi:hypothetical protein
LQGFTWPFVELTSHFVQIRYLAEVVPVKEVFQGKTVWDGAVHVFDLEGNTKGTRAYAWSSPVEGSTKRRFYAVLHLGGIRSPLDAVRAAIVAEQRAR